MFVLDQICNFIDSSFIFSMTSFSGFAYMWSVLSTAELFLHSIDKLSLIRSLNLFSLEAKISELPKSIVYVRSG